MTTIRDNKSIVLAAYNEAAEIADKQFSAAIDESQAQHGIRVASLAVTMQAAIQKAQEDEARELNRNRLEQIAIVCPAQELMDKALEEPAKIRNAAVRKAREILSDGRAPLRLFCPAIKLTRLESDVEEILLEDLQADYNTSRDAAIAAYSAAETAAKALYVATVREAAERFEANEFTIRAVSSRAIATARQTFQDDMQRVTQEHWQIMAASWTQSSVGRRDRMDIWKKFIDGTVDTDAAVAALKRLSVGF